MEQINLPVTNKALYEIFDMQKDLIKYYQVVENLPEYPVDLNTLPGKKTVKEFISRTIYELAEGYDELLLIFNHKANNTQFNEVEALSRFNEEIADALHFFVELLIFSGIEAAGIEQWLLNTSLHNLEAQRLYVEGNPLLSLFRIAEGDNIRDGLSFNQLLKDRTAFRVLDEIYCLQGRMDCLGGRLIGPEIMVLHNGFLWEITYMLSKAGSNLKVKEWSQVERTANTVAFHENLMEVLLHFFRYLDFIGHNGQGIYNAYYRKNQILQKRIKDGY